MPVELFNQEFEEIIRPLKSYLLRITASISDAEDIVQDTYIKALENYAKGNKMRANLRRSLQFEIISDK